MSIRAKRESAANPCRPMAPIDAHPEFLGDVAADPLTQPRALSTMTRSISPNGLLTGAATLRRYASTSG